MPMDFRKDAGRPGKGEPPAPVEELRSEIPAAMKRALEARAKDLKMSRQRAVREAIALWLDTTNEAPK
jgi:hypothetical protein